MRDVSVQINCKLKISKTTFDNKIKSNTGVIYKTYKTKIPEPLFYFYTKYGFDINYIIYNEYFHDLIEDFNVTRCSENNAIMYGEDYLIVYSVLEIELLKVIALGAEAENE